MLVNRQRFKSTQTQHEQRMFIYLLSYKMFQVVSLEHQQVGNVITLSGKVCYGGGLSFTNGIMAKLCILSG